ncbi:hypothetical protein PENTCL1PPCAC_24111, partial [Pristionchus entomophagus]
QTRATTFNDIQTDYDRCGDAALFNDVMESSHIDRLTDEMGRMQTPRQSANTDASMKSLNDTKIECVECKWFDEPYSQAQPNMCELCVNWRWRLPRYGGSPIIDGTKYEIVNTCSLDSFLAVLIFYCAENWQLLEKKIGTSSLYDKWLKHILFSGSEINESKAYLIQECYSNLLKSEQRKYDLESTDYDILKELTKSASVVTFAVRCKSCSTSQSLHKTRFEAITTTPPKETWTDIIVNIVMDIGTCKLIVNEKRCGGEMEVGNVAVNAWFIPVDISLFKRPAKDATKFPIEINVNEKKFKLGGM